MGFVRDCFTWEAKHSQISALSVEINTTILYEKENGKKETLFRRKRSENSFSSII